MATRQLEVESNRTSTDVQGFKLLLVDENAEDLEYYSAVLRYLGCEVRSVNSYVKAAALLGHERVDLVIVDQGGSDFEGRSVLTRAVEVDRCVPVLVLTRIVDAGCCTEALDSGAYEYVQKPLTTAEVRELISDYLNRSIGIVPARGDYVPQRDLAELNRQHTEREPMRKAS